MTNNKRPLSQRPSTYKQLPFTIGGSKPRTTPVKASNQNIDGIDRKRIDKLAEDRRDKELFSEVWDE